MPNTRQIRPLTFLQMVTVFNRSPFVHWADLPYRHLSESWVGVFAADTLIGWAGLRGHHGALCVVTLEAPDQASQSMLLGYAIDQAVALRRPEMGFDTHHLDAALAVSITAASTRVEGGLHYCPIESIQRQRNLQEHP